MSDPGIPEQPGRQPTELQRKRALQNNALQRTKPAQAQGLRR